jgi:hypothetical protein
VNHAPWLSLFFFKKKKKKKHETNNFNMYVDIVCQGTLDHTCLIHRLFPAPKLGQWPPAGSTFVFDIEVISRE